MAKGHAVVGALTDVDLDPDVLSEPFEIQTNWHVLTGAACTGKTTLISMLAERGYRTVPETARLYIEHELGRGRTIEEVFADAGTEPAIDTMQVRAEQALRPTDVVFLDRALPDSITFRRWRGLDPNDILPACLRHRYASVFVLDRLPLRLDGARIDDDAFSTFLDEWLVRDYEALGYRVIRVPVMAPGDRLDFVLRRLSHDGLIQAERSGRMSPPGPHSDPPTRQGCVPPRATGP